MSKLDPGFARFMREFRNCDPLSLGNDAPEDEYQAVAVAALKLLRRGASVSETLSAVEGLFSGDWGADLSDLGRSRLEALLTSWRGR